MKRLAITRSEWSARQPSAGRAQWSVGSIEAVGTRYGFATSTFTARTTTTAMTIESVQSSTLRHGSGTRLVRRSRGFFTSAHLSGRPEWLSPVGRSVQFVGVLDPVRGSVRHVEPTPREREPASGTRVAQGRQGTHLVRQVPHARSVIGGVGHRFFSWLPNVSS
jgi:hypothetical protein